MKTKIIKDMMIPLSEYATVSEDAQLYEAINALDKAQARFDPSRYRHRAVLILNKEKKVVGKLSQLDVLRALEPKYSQMFQNQRISRFGFTSRFLKSMRDQYSLFEKPLEHICEKAANYCVKNFMQTPTEGEYIDENDSLDVAIHRLVMGDHQSLLVMSGDKIVGVVRLTDVYHEISNVLHESV